MLYYEKKFGASGKNISLNEKQTKNTLMLLFTIMGGVFAIIGFILVLTARSADDYTKNGEYLFTYVQTNQENRTSRTKVNGRTKTSTTTYYVPMYVGEVEGESYTYDYHKEFSEEKLAMDFIGQNEAILVTAYLNSENQLYFLASDRTLEEHFKWEKTIGFIFAGVGTIFVVLGVSVGLGKIPAKNREDTLI